MLTDEIKELSPADFFKNCAQLTEHSIFAFTDFVFKQKYIIRIDLTKSKTIKHNNTRYAIFSDAEISSDGGKTFNKYKELHLAQTSFYESVLQEVRNNKLDLSSKQHIQFSLERLNKYNTRLFDLSLEDVSRGDTRIV